MNASEFKSAVWDCLRKINESTSSIFEPLCKRYGLTMLQVDILEELSRHECNTIGGLADNICMAGTNISAMCKKLEGMGLLVRSRDKNDERVVKVTLTEKGNIIVLEMNQLCNEKFLPYINDEQAQALSDIINGMQKLNELFQKIVSDQVE